jgi:hypothetical protein
MFVFNSDSPRKRLVLQESTIYNQDTYNSVVTLKKGTRLRNAKGTTGDTIECDGKDYGNMIELWEDATEDVAVSCSNKYCQCDDLDIGIYDIVGAHVVKDGNNTNIKRGDKVLIIPLCKSCNHYHNEDAIILKEDTKAVVLKWD